MKDVSGYATREISPTMEAFADYLIAEVYGGTLPAEIDEAAFRKGVALGGSTRGYFQASERWKSDPRNYLANVDANRAAKAEERANRAKASLAKAEERAANAIAKAEEIAAKARAKAEEIAAKIAESAPETFDATGATVEPDAPVESLDATILPEDAPTPASVRRSRRAA